MIEFLNAKLAEWFDKFKADSPLIYAIFVAGIVGLNHFLSNSNILPENETNKAILDFVSYLVLMLSGTRTTRFIQKPNQ